MKKFILLIVALIYTSLPLYSVSISTQIEKIEDYFNPNEKNLTISRAVVNSAFTSAQLLIGAFTTILSGVYIQEIIRSKGDRLFGLFMFGAFCGGIALIKPGIERANQLYNVLKKGSAKEKISNI